MYKNSPWFGGPIHFLPVEAACLRLIIVFLFDATFGLFGLVNVAYGMNSVVEHEHMDSLLSGDHKDDSLQEV